MNKLFIIGNGLDLASGIKSRYSDFILNLINEQLDKITPTNHIVECKLFRIKKKPTSNFVKYSLKDISEISKFAIHTDYIFFGSPETQRHIRETPDSLFNFYFKSKLFYEILRKDNWSDIERVYFELLLTVSVNDENKEILNDLNSDFQFIKTELIKYLSIAEQNFIPNSTITKVFNESLSIPNFLLQRYSNSPEAHIIINRLYQSFLGNNQLMFLNFNYTSTVHKYLDLVASSRYEKEIINIHGRIEDENDSVVFGYGDEMNEHFKRLEELNEDGYLEFFKSNYYTDNVRYLKLLNFIEFPYEVIIIGHSLGLSDRVLLNTILENKECKAIHIFHTGEKSHFKKRLSMARHFDDKTELRRLLMPKNLLLHFDREAKNMESVEVKNN